MTAHLLILKRGYVFTDPKTGRQHDIMRIMSDDTRLAGQAHKFETEQKVARQERNRTIAPPVSRWAYNRMARPPRDKMARRYADK